MAANLQQIEPVVRGEGSDLDVIDVFYTIQGEGPFAGEPAVFVRLAGCNKQCPACDTEYTQGRQMVSLPTLLDRIEKASPRPETLVVLTGGEPLRQPIGKLCRALLWGHYRVQIETNGTLPPEDLPLSDDGGESVVLVCSPKGPHVHPKLLPWVDSYKYVLRAGEVDPADGLPTTALGLDYPPARPPSDFPRSNVFVNPCDDGDPEANARNLRAAAESCLRFGWRLGVQIHKLANLA